MTIEEINARIDAIDDCTAVLFKVFFEYDCTNPQIKEMFTELWEQFITLRDTAINEFAQKFDELSKQA